MSRDQVFMYAEGWDGATVPRWLILFNYLKNVWKNLLYLCCSSFFKKKKKRNGKGSYSNKDKYSIIQTPNILFRFIIVLAQNIKWFKRLRSWCLQCCMTGRILLWPFFHPKYPLIWNGKGKCLSSLLSGKIEQTCGCSSDVLWSSSNSSSPVYILRFKQFHQRVHFSLHRFWC